MYGKGIVEAVVGRIEVYRQWHDSYVSFVPRFVAEAQAGKRWEDWDKGVFYEYFERSQGQCVASVAQKYFTRDDRARLKSAWHEVAPLLKAIAEHQDEPQWEAYRQLKKVVRAHTAQDLRAATNRLVAGLQPRLLCSIVAEHQLEELYMLLGRHVSDRLPEYRKGDWFANSYNITRLFCDALQPADPMDIVTYPWQLLEYLRDKDNKQYLMDNYIEEKAQMLERVKNMVLTGPPGTGKTYLARRMAMKLVGVDTDEQLAASGQFGFVQFHPSYDYTDFVEGLRPVQSDDNGNVGFELRDGVFKQFCRKAMEKGSMARLDEAIERFKDDCSETPVKVKNKSGYEFSVAYRGGVTFRVRSDKSEAAEGRDFPANIDSIKRLYGGRKDGIYNMAYVSNILQHLKDNYGVPEYKADMADRKYVFVIDEINRGEVSKVFGELFFSIDPGYRGPRGAVATQYANMHEGSELFYVPANVYIIGTMNDIDRSVESFDFAMRRRFAWVEVTAGESAVNMRLPADVAERMGRLNDAISETEGLGSAYHVGGAYFLGTDGRPDTDIRGVWRFRIEPLLREYLRGLPAADAKLEALRTAFMDGGKG